MVRFSTRVGSNQFLDSRPVMAEISRLAVVFIAYFVAVLIGLKCRIEPQSISAIWPPSGVALAALLLVERRKWISTLLVVFAANTLGNFSWGNPLPASLALAAANTLECDLGAWMIVLLCGPEVTFSRVKEILALAVVTLVVNGITALSGAAAALFSFNAPFFSTWMMWWISDGLGILLITPMIVLWKTGTSLFRVRFSVQKGEGFSLLTGTILLSFLILSHFESEYYSIFHVYLYFILIIWSALRFDVRLTVTLLFIMTVTMLWNAATAVLSNGILGHDIGEQLIVMQVFISTSVFSGLMLAAIVGERRRTNESLQESEEKYRSMMEAMKDAAYICSPDYRIEYMNPKMVARLGRDATGEYCYKAIYGAEEQCRWCVFDRVRAGEHVDYDLISPKDGRYYSVSNSPIIRSGPSVSKLTIFRDITEGKHLEEQLRQAQKMESIGTLTAGIAHDFNNILYTIIGNTELALEDIPEWNPTHGNLEDIKAAGLRASGIVKQLLSYSRKNDAKLIPIGVAGTIRDTLQLMRSVLPSSTDLRTHLPDTDISILADHIQIGQVLINICTNASQAMEETGGILDVTLSTTSVEKGGIKNFPDLPPGEYAEITIKDTGPGIDPGITDRIFDPYFTTKAVGKGSGMGLSVVLGIVLKHGGAVTVESRPGEGAAFKVLLPVVNEEPFTEMIAPEELPRGDETILFVDDELPLVNMTRMMLERLGYTIETRTDPKDAATLFRMTPDRFDLIITDMTMPRMSGVGLAEQLREIRKDIPVIICTGHSSLIDQEKAGELGINALVMKPLMGGDLAKTIRRVLDAAKRTTGLESNNDDFH